MIILAQKPKHIGHEKSVVNFRAQFLNDLNILDLVTIKVNPIVASRKRIKSIIN